MVRRVLMALAAAFLLLFTTVHFNDAFARGGRGGGGMRAGGFHGGGMRAGGFHGGRVAGGGYRGGRVAGGYRGGYLLLGAATVAVTLATAAMVTAATATVRRRSVPPRLVPQRRGRITAAAAATAPMATGFARTTGTLRTKRREAREKRRTPPLLAQQMSRGFARYLTARRRQRRHPPLHDVRRGITHRTSMQRLAILLIRLNAAHHRFRKPAPAPAYHALRQSSQ